MAQEDRASVLELFGQFIAHEAGIDPAMQPFVEDRVSDPGAAASYLEYCESSSIECDGRLVVAESQERVVGFMCWIIATDGVFVKKEYRRIGEILFVVVGQAYRGMGIGDLLVSHAEELTRKAGLNRLSLMVMAGNKRPIGFYENRRFETRAYRMLKKLS